MTPNVDCAQFATYSNKKSTYEYFVNALKHGAEGQNRTADTGIFSPLLYRLSYLGVSVLATAVTIRCMLVCQVFFPKSPYRNELYLKVVFKGKGGVSTGRLLAAVNRPH